MIVVKFHKGLNKVVAICDKNLIGKTFSDGNIEIKIGEYFYGGNVKSEEEVDEIMKNYDNLNIVGKESVGLAIKSGVIDKEKVIFIKKVPHAQTISF